MPQNAFYEDNLKTGYPLTGAYGDAIRSLLADAEVYIRQATRYRHSQHTVSLGGVLLIDGEQAESVGQPGALAVLVLQSTVPSETQQGLCFLTGEALTQKPIIAYERSDIAKWLNKTQLLMRRTSVPNIWGTIVEGEPDLSSYIPTHGARVLPSRVIVSSYVVSQFGKVTVVNERGEVSKPALGCEHVVDPSKLDGEKIVTPCGALSSQIRFAGGIKSSVQQDSNRNAIVISADGSVGDVCGEDADPARFHRESAFETPCDEILRTINGQPASPMSFANGNGTAVEEHPALSRVVVRIGSSDLAICTIDQEDKETEHLPNNEDGVPCGYGGEGIPPAEKPDGSTGFLKKVQPLKTVPTNPPVNCLWRWSDNAWAPISSSCKSPTYCRYPESTGLYDLQEIYTPCLFPSINFELPVTNGSLEDEYPLNGWDASNAVLLRNQEDSPEFNLIDLPIAELQPGGVLQQKGIQTAPASYVLQFDSQVIGPGGELTVVMSSMDGAANYVTKLITGPDSFTTQVLGPYNLIDASTQLRFINSGNTVVRIRFIDLVKQ